MTETNETKDAAPARAFSLQRIYVKDLSFETPNSPSVFTQEWKPETQMNLSTQTNHLGGNSFEVVLTVTLTTKLGETAAYLVEVQQAGIFGVRDFPESEIAPLLGSYCPGILFPYARETVSDLISRGSFPQLLLTPVNFDALFEQHVREQAARQSAAGSKASA
jgi:preprotein translocase subunit SecB